MRLRIDLGTLALLLLLTGLWLAFTLAPGCASPRPTELVPAECRSVD
jgi:hypothetical protein